jgi:hypothetical protein
MPAHVKPNGLLLTFHRDGGPVEQQIVADGWRAVSVAMRMLATKDALQAGDRLTVENGTAAPSIVPRQS